MKTRDHTIDDFIARVQCGEREAYRHVVERTIESVRAFVVGRSLPGVEVDDVIQRSFIEAYWNLKDYKLGTDFTAWVVTIAKYQLLMESSRVRRRSDYHARFAPYAMSRAVEARVQGTAKDEDIRLIFLRDCLSQLNEASQRVLKDRYELGTSIDQIATSHSRTSGAIRKQLCVLRKLLHECISKKLALESLT
jgi:RNA polymerase sigma-70 factor, ECF subfamily